MQLTFSSNTPCVFILQYTYFLDFNLFSVDSYPQIRNLNIKLVKNFPEKTVVYVPPLFISKIVGEARQIQ